MRQKRIKKHGRFYILKSLDGSYKFGVTCNDVKHRIYHANKIMKTKFNLLYERECDDIFNFECRFKWKMWDDLIAIGEFFNSREDFNDEKLISIAEKI